MNFSTILKNIEGAAPVASVLSGAATAGPALDKFVPGVSGVIDGVQAMVAAAGAKSGSVVIGAPGIKPIITDALDVALPFVQTLLKAHGYTLTLNVAALDALIDASIAEFSAVEAFHTGFSFEKTPVVEKPA